MSVPRFRSRPVEVEAMQWTGDNAEEIKAFTGKRDNGEDGFLLPEEITGAWTNPQVYDVLHKTWVLVNLRDWIIRGTKGEFSPCVDDVFREKYEPA